MKYWNEILNEIPVLAKAEQKDFEVLDIKSDSRKITKGDAFIAIRGLTVDGHEYIAKAIENGASAIIGTDLDKLNDLEIPWCQTEEDPANLARLANVFFEFPTNDFKLIGITGTNGKTTTASLLHDLYSALGYKVGLVSTIEIRIGSETKSSTHTTPDALTLQRTFNEMRRAGCDYVFMEVSSHALAQERVAYCDFDIGVFTNLSHDHLDYHKSFKEYIQAKKKFFDQLKKKAISIINDDDKNGSVMVQNTKSNIIYYGLRKMADYKSKILSNEVAGLFLKINNNESYFRLSGEFNAYNLTAVYAVAMELGQNSEEVLRIMSGLHTANGRLERVDVEGLKFTIYVDYAHTPDALENVLKTLNQMKKSTAKITTVVGCGGNRDKAKRPKMAKIGAKGSDLLILTSDNPRDEDPEAILNDMQKGIEIEEEKKVLRIADRAMAIKTACMMAKDNDIILVAGKGHETYQEVKGEKLPFDDKKVIKATLLKT